jgi:hypothetical protein
MLMTLRQREDRIHRKPVEPPVNLDRGALHLPSTLGGIVTGVGLLVGAVLALSLAAAVPVAWLSMPFLVLAGGTGVSGGIILWLVWSEPFAHRRRVEEWHAATLASYARGNDTEMEYTQRETVLDWENPAHLLPLALEVHRRVCAGEPWGVHALASAGALWMRDGHRYARICTLTQDSVQAGLNALAARGFIAGRTERFAGSWLPVDDTDIISRFRGRAR